MRDLSDAAIRNLRERAEADLAERPCSGCYGCEGGGQFCFGEIANERRRDAARTIEALIKATQPDTIWDDE